MEKIGEKNFLKEKIISQSGKELAKPLRSSKKKKHLHFNLGGTFQDILKEIEKEDTAGYDFEQISFREKPYSGTPNLTDALETRDIFSVGDVVLVNISNKKTKIGDVAFYQGKYQILATEGIPTILSTIEPANVEKIERDILSGKKKITYNDVSFHEGTVVDKNKKGEHLFIYKVKLIDGREVIVPYERILKRNIGFVLLVNINKGLRTFLISNLKKVLYDYFKGKTIFKVSKSKEPWSEFYQKKFSMWYTSEILKKLKESGEIERIRQREIIVGEHEQGEHSEHERKGEIELSVSKAIQHKLEVTLSSTKATNEDHIRFQSSFLENVKKEYESLPEYIIEEKQGETLDFIDLDKEVFEYESDIYWNFGTDIKEYVKVFVFPYLFLSNLSPLKPYAEFFKAKLESGVFSVKSLRKYKLPQFIPEVFISGFLLKETSENEFDEFLKFCGECLEFISDYILETYTSTIDPKVSVRHSISPVLPKHFETYFMNVKVLCKSLEIRNVKVCLENETFTCKLLTN